MKVLSEAAEGVRHWQEQTKLALSRVQEAAEAKARALAAELEESRQAEKEGREKIAQLGRELDKARRDAESN